MVAINNVKDRKIPLRIKRFTHQVNRRLHRGRPLLPVDWQRTRHGEGDPRFAKAAKMKRAGAATTRDLFRAGEGEQSSLQYLSVSLNRYHRCRLHNRSPITMNSDYGPNDYGVGRGNGVGRGRGVTLGVAVGGGVVDGVGVGVTDGVTVGVGDGGTDGVGVGEGVAPAAQKISIDAAGTPVAS
jgi:hypothetical protein